MHDIDEILKKLKAERISSKMSKTRNSGLYRLGLTKAIDIILERRERKEHDTEASGFSKHNVKKSVCDCNCNCDWEEWEDENCNAQMRCTNCKTVK